MNINDPKDKQIELLKLQRETELAQIAFTEAKKNGNAIDISTAEKMWLETKGKLKSFVESF